MKRKDLIWVGSSKKDLLEFPEEIRRDVGYALHLAQVGEHAPSAKVLTGFGSAGVVEIIEKDASGTFRVVYTVQMSDIVFVLHSFQKKSKRGIETPKAEIDLVKARLKEAQQKYKELGHDKKKK